MENNKGKSSADSGTRFVSIADCMNSDVRRYLPLESVVSSYTKGYKYKTDDQRLLALSMDGAASGYGDAYIMYALAYMGASTKESIYAVLKALRMRYPGLSIVDSPDQVDARIRAIQQEGYTISFGYSVTARYPGTTVNNGYRIAIYTATTPAYFVVRQRLSLPSFSENQGFANKSIEEIIGWAATSFCASQLMLASHFYELTTRQIKTKEMNYFLPFEMRCKVESKGNEVKCSVGFMTGFFYRNTQCQDEKLFAEACIYKMNVCRNYFYSRDKSGASVLVFVCADYTDMESVARWILISNSLVEYRDRIFFTGEGLVRECSDPHKWLLRVVDDGLDADTRQRRVHFETVSPFFLRSN